jgi:hypothetical protein
MSPLLWVLVGGLLVRVAVMGTYSTAVFNYYDGDATRYARLPLGGFQPGLFGDPTAPAGYPAFLLVLRHIWPALGFTIAVQHLVGLLIAVVLYAATRRAGAPRLLAVLPAAVVAFSGDQLFLESALLTEVLWALLICGGLLSLVTSMTSERYTAWLLAGGAFLGLAALVRQDTIPLIVVAGLWAALAKPGSLLARAFNVAAVWGPAGVAIGGYFAVVLASGGQPGIAQQTGYQLYGRVAQFADCSRFKPPGRTRLLCETTPPARRPGPTAYLFSPAAPLQARFHAILPQDSALLGRFARAAIIHQPGDYIAAVAQELGREIGINSARPGEGANPDQMRFDSPVKGAPHGESTPAAVAAYFRLRYSHVKPTPRGRWAKRWSTYQSIVRVHERLVLPLLLITLLGLAVATRRIVRATIALFLASALVLYIVPPLVAQWDVRYGLLAGELLVVGATLGAWTLWERFRPPPKVMATTRHRSEQPPTYDDEVIVGSRASGTAST